MVLWKRSVKAWGALLALAVAGAGAQSPTQPDPPLASPCTEAAPACTEWLTIRGGPGRGLVYRSYALDAPNAKIRRALVMVHGTSRNPDHYFRTALGAAFLAGARGDTIVVAPGFFSSDQDCKDKLEPNQVNWGCRGDSWRSGGASPSHPNLTSFEFMDEILRRLADKRIFPGLETVVIAGHSAGGQFVSRYQMANRVGETLGLKVSYVVANPSSYAWPDATRPEPVGDAAPENAAQAWKSDKPHTGFTYGPFDSGKAPKYDLWPYGLEGRSGGYTARMSDGDLRRNLVERTATYLFGQVDTFPLGGFDASPGAMAQGPTRRARGEAFVQYSNQHYGAHGRVVIIPECGHNDRCIFTSDAALPFLFPAR